MGMYEAAIDIGREFDHARDFPLVQNDIIQRIAFHDGLTIADYLRVQQKAFFYGVFAVQDLVQAPLDFRG